MFCAIYYAYTLDVEDYHFYLLACTSGNYQFTYCWSLAWGILSITLLACEISTIVQKSEHSLALSFFKIGIIEKHQKISSANENMNKLEYYAWLGNVKVLQPIWITVWWFLKKKKKIEYPILSWNSTYRYILQGIGSTDSDICIPMFLELFTNSQKLETLECQSIEYKYNYTHTHTHIHIIYHGKLWNYVAFKRNEFLTHGTIWIKLENLMLTRMS